MKPRYGLFSVLGSMPEPIRFWIVFSTACRAATGAQASGWGRGYGAHATPPRDTAGAPRHVRNPTARLPG
jgi:hypothetical protein